MERGIHMAKLGKITLAVAVSLALALSTAAVAGASQPAPHSRPPVAQAAGLFSSTIKTAEFLVHAGLAFGAFHHFIYEPFEAGDFKHPSEHKATVVTAALAAVFVYHEVKEAASDAQGSKALKTLFAPVTVLAAKFGSLGSALKSGNASSISGIESSVGSIESSASKDGHSIKEVAPPLSSL